MNFLGNIIWLVFGGFIAAAVYVGCGIVLCFTIVGIPFGYQCFKIATFVALPFGQKVIPGESAAGCLGTIFNIIWLLTGGLITGICHIGFGLLLCITIIGIPFGKKHFQLVELSMMPFSKRIVAA
jgi:uncharacterized membrane protein YccF (DUF307 family)